LKIEISKDAQHWQAIAREYADEYLQPLSENVAERFFRELRVDRIWEGTSEIQRLIIARSLLKRGLDGM